MGEIYMVSDYTLQTIFKKLILVYFEYSFKEECLPLSGKAIKILPFPTTYLFEVKLLSYTQPEQHMETDLTKI